MMRLFTQRYLGSIIKWTTRKRIFVIDNVFWLKSGLDDKFLPTRGRLILVLYIYIYSLLSIPLIFLSTCNYIKFRTFIFLSLLFSWNFLTRYHLKSWSLLNCVSHLWINNLKLNLEHDMTKYLGHWVVRFINGL